MDEFSYHEVLDRAFIVYDIFNDHILYHDVVQSTPELEKAAMEISILLHSFYQMAGNMKKR